MASTAKHRAAKEARRLDAMERALRSLAASRLPSEPQGFHDKITGEIFSETDVADALRDLRARCSRTQGQ